MLVVLLLFALGLVCIRGGTSLGQPHSASVINSRVGVSGAASTAMEVASPELPEWYTTLLKSSPLVEKLNVKEWEDEEWRQGEGGWRGRDYVHSASAPCRILEYALIKPPPSAPADPLVLTGVAYFSPRAESHKGFCHGGSLCALMDDCVGWLGFCVGGKCEPWSGYTVQIDTTLKKPIPVGALLKIEGVIESVERRKVWIRVNVTDPVSGSLHGSCRGLFLVNKQEQQSQPSVSSSKL